MTITDEHMHHSDWTDWKMDIMAIHFLLPARELDWHPPWEGIKDFQEALKAFRDWESSSELHLSLAATSLAAGNPPPAKPAASGMAFGLRLDEVLEWIDDHWTDRGSPVPAPGPGLRGRIVDWLLTDYWETRGRARCVRRWIADDYFGNI